MFRIFLLSILFLSAGFVRGQSIPADTLTTPPHRFVMGLNLAQALSGFIGNDGFTEDPYLLTFRFGGERRRARFGINFRVKDKTDTTFNGKLTQKEKAFQLRGGYEWVFPVARRWDFYWGIDGVLENVKTELKTTGFGGVANLKTRQWGFGLGPVIGFAWRVHPRVSLSTECSVYAIVRRGKEEVTAFPDQSVEPEREFSWQPQLPTSLFINFSF